MATDESFADFVVEQMSDAGVVSHRKMFGEYAVYCDGKVVALVCDNSLFVKPTDGGRAYIGTPVEMHPYPGAKNYFLIDDMLENRDRLCGLVQVTLRELPSSKPRRKKARKRVPLPNQRRFAD